MKSYKRLIQSSTLYRTSKLVNTRYILAHHIPLRYQSTTTGDNESKSIGSLSTLQGKVQSNTSEHNTTDESATAGSVASNQQTTVERSADKLDKDAKQSQEPAAPPEPSHDTDSKPQSDDLAPKGPITNSNDDSIIRNEASEPLVLSQPLTAASPKNTEPISSQNASIPMQSVGGNNDNNSNDHSDKPNETTAANSPAPASEIRGLLWFDNLYPLRAAYIDFRHFLVSHNHQTTIPAIMEKAAPNVEICEMIPRIKEGGVFVRFKTTDTTNYPSAEAVSEAVIKELKNHPRRAWLTPQPIHAHLVYGSPFLEDLLRLFPANRLRIELKADIKLLNEVTVEQLYQELRPFGTIADMSLGTVPDKPNLPRIATVIYQRMYSAVGARNCLHRYKIPIGSGGSESTGVVMYLYYESLLKTSIIADFFNKHTRIMVPLLGLLFALITYLVFDPIREFNVINHITKRFTLQSLETQYSQSRLVRWLNEKYQDARSSRFFKSMMGHNDNNASNIEIVWSGRKLDEDKVTKWLHSIPDRILFLTGPKGAGKMALVDKVTKDKCNVISIDFGPLMDKSDDDFVKSLSNSLGFKPGFTFLSIVNQLMDLITPGASKATGSQNAFGTQIGKILEVTSGALMEIAKKYHPQDVEIKRATSATNNNASIQHKTPTGKPVTIDTTKTASEASKDKVTQDGRERKEKQDGLDKAVDHKLTQPDTAQHTTSAPKPSDTKHETDVKIDNSDGNDNDSIFKSMTDGVTSGINSVTGLFKSNDNDKAQVEQLAHKKPIDSDDHTSAHADDGDDNHNESNHTNNNRDDNNENDSIPLFIIDGFNTDNKDKHSNFLLTFTQWSDSMTKLGLARFLYLSDSTLEEYIAKQLPDTKLTEVMLADASKDNAIEFVQSSMRRIREADMNYEQSQRHRNIRSNENIAKTLVTNEQLAQQQQSQQQSNATQQQSTDDNASPLQILVDDIKDEINDLTQSDDATQPDTPQLQQRQQPADQQQSDEDTISDEERDAQELSEIKQAIDVVGGRYNDLQTLVRGLESGSTPREVVEDMVSVAINSIRSVLFSNDNNKKINPVQLWLTMNKLIAAPKNQLLYDDVLFNIFKGDDNSLRQLVRYDLLRIEQQSHSKDRIKAGSGIQMEAFKRMVELEKLRPGFDLAVAKSMLSDEQKKIDQYTDELLKLSNIMHNELDLRKQLSIDESTLLHPNTNTNVTNNSTAVSIAKRRIDVLRLLNDSVDKYAEWDMKRRQAEAEIKKPVQLIKDVK